MNKLTIPSIIAGAVFLSIATVVLTLSISSWGLQRANANPSQITASSTSPTGATTTVFYLIAGVGTTTFMLDAQGDGGSAADSAALGVQFTGSSTTSTLTIQIERSMDGIVWFSDTLNPGTTASSSLSLNTVNAYTLSFASSTANQIGGASPLVGTTSIYRILSVATPTRYTRAVFSELGAPNLVSQGAVWAMWISKRENR